MTISPLNRPLEPAYDYGAERRRRAEEVEREHEKEDSPARQQGLARRWRNTFSRYDVRESEGSIEIALVETCLTAGCDRKNYPDRPVFRGKLEGTRLIGVVLIHSAVGSEQNDGRCSTPAGEFPVEGKLSGDGRTITWGRVRFPVREECAPLAFSLGTWRRE